MCPQCATPLAFSISLSHQGPWRKPKLIKQGVTHYLHYIKWGSKGSQPQNIQAYRLVWMKSLQMNWRARHFHQNMQMLVQFPVKALLQDFPRKGPFFLRLCKIMRDLARSCKILWDFAGILVQYSCKILAGSCKDARKRTFSLKILQKHFYWGYLHYSQVAPSFRIQFHKTTLTVA